MKINTKKTITALALTLSVSSIQASTLTALSGTTADGVGYTISGNTPTFLTSGGIETGGNSGGTVTFTFDEAVNFSISNVASDTSVKVVFDGSGANNTFTSDVGVWNYAAGSIDINETISGSTVSVAASVGGSNANGNLFYSDDWGKFTVNAVNEVTWTYTNNTNFEAFTFAAVGVPEPSSSALLGLGALALLARRRR